MPDPMAHLPVKPVDLILLLALAEADRHGYALAQEVERRTGGAARLEAGNLYRTLRRLLADGLVADSGRRPAGELDDERQERRRYFRLTPLGLAVLRAELERLRALLASDAVRRLRRERGPEPA